MKKVIKGKKYDTETAKCVGVWWSDNNPTDLWFSEESLYRKKTNEYFLYKDGNAGSSYCGGEIVPLTEEKAREWAEYRLDGNEYESIFGKVDE